MSNQIQLNEDTTITLDYTDILSIFGTTKLIKSVGSLTLSKWAVEIEGRLESKLKNSSE